MQSSAEANKQPLNCGNSSFKYNLLHVKWYTLKYYCGEAYQFQKLTFSGTAYVTSETPAVTENRSCNTTVLQKNVVTAEPKSKKLQKPLNCQKSLSYNKAEQLLATKPLQ